MDWTLTSIAYPHKSLPLDTSTLPQKKGHWLTKESVSAFICMEEGEEFRPWRSSCCDLGMVYGKGGDMYLIHYQMEREFEEATL